MLRIFEPQEKPEKSKEYKALDKFSLFLYKMRVCA